jgi:hypothetical protein
VGQDDGHSGVVGVRQGVQSKWPHHPPGPYRVTCVHRLGANATAAHMNWCLHLGVGRTRALPSLTADAPPQLARAMETSCPNSIGGNATLICLTPAAATNRATLAA